MRIVVADEFAEGAETLSDLLSYLGHQVTVAKTGPEAVEICRAIRPDLAFIDLALPGFDGYEVARRLRSTGLAGGMRLLAVSGLEKTSSDPAVATAGFETVVQKPYDVDRIKGVLAGPATPPE